MKKLTFVIFLFILLGEQIMGAVKITTVFDNTSLNPNCTPEWGFAAVLELPDETILFDTGNDGHILFDNLTALGFGETTFSKVVISHMHWDHTDALGRYLAQWPNAQVAAPGPLSSVSGARVVGEGDSIECGPLRLEVLRTSGHTPDSVSYYCAAAGVCFTGDALFAGSVGGTGSDAAYKEQLDHLRRKILTLPDETEIHPGHGPMSTVAIEKRANPFFRPGFGRTG